jgi:hypothetical protein
MSKPLLEKDSIMCAPNLIEAVLFLPSGVSVATIVYSWSRLPLANLSSLPSVTVYSSKPKREAKVGK